MVEHGLGFIGTYTIRLLKGYRIVLPSQLRQVLGQRKLVGTLGFDGAVLLVPVDRWNKLIHPLKNSNYFNSRTRDLLRYIVAHSYEINVDMHGRLVIPAGLRGYIVKDDAVDEVVVVGMLDYIEVWNPKAWHKKVREIQEEGHKIADVFYASEN